MDGFVKRRENLFVNSVNFTYSLYVDSTIPHVNTIPFFF